MNRLALRLKGISRHGSSAADLKFLHRLRQTHFRNFKSKSGTRPICLLVPLLLPKFVSKGAAMYHELRKRGTSPHFSHSMRPALLFRRGRYSVGRRKAYRGRSEERRVGKEGRSRWSPYH